MSGHVLLGVPTLNRYDLLLNLLDSARSGSRRPTSIIVIDNGGSFIPGPRLNDPLVVDVQLGSGFRIEAEIQTPEQNLGVAASWNRLAHAYKAGPDVPGKKLLICGDDVTLHVDTIAALEDTMDATDADFVFPDPARSTMHQMFSCFMVKQSLFDKVGYFDEKFWPAYFEDNDFHMRMKRAGATEAIAPCGYDHVNSGTMKKFSPEETEQHHARFRACRDYYVSKWGGLPGFEAFAEPFNGTRKALDL